MGGGGGGGELEGRMKERTERSRGGRKNEQGGRDWEGRGGEGGIRDKRRGWRKDGGDEGHSLNVASIFCSIANRLSRTEPFAISHLKLMKDDDTTIQDGIHELFVYKV